MSVTPVDSDVNHTGTKKRRRTSESTPGVESEPQTHKIHRSASSDKSLLDLRELLDVSLLSNGPDISRRFDEMADALLHDFSISSTCGETVTELEILELECYLYKSGCHEDPFTHGSDEQKRSGQWYFHRAPKRSADSHRSPTAAGGYRGGSRKGLDLTIGRSTTVNSPYFSKKVSDDESSSSLLRGGILLRTLRRVSDSKIISGPSLLVDEILRLSGAGNISELVNQMWGGDIVAFPPTSSSATSRSTYLHLRKKSSTPAAGKRPPTYRSPRIGLDLSHPGTTNSPTHPRVVYVSKPYRYFILPTLLTSNGRGQTFLGVYQTCLDSGRYGSSDKAALRRDLMKLTGLGEAAVIKYTADYQFGADSGHLHSFIGAAGKGASASPSTYLRMMGTLHRLQTQTSEAA